jgi:hypothetical protein
VVVEPSFAAVRAKGKVAPIPVIRANLTERVEATLRSHPAVSRFASEVANCARAARASIATYRAKRLLDGNC